MNKKYYLATFCALIFITIFGWYFLKNDKSDNDMQKVIKEESIEEAKNTDESVHTEETMEIFRADTHGDDSGKKKKTITKVDVDLLRQKFPNNKVLPSRNDEERKIKQREKERRNLAFGQIEANRATVEEIKAFYAEQMALAKDSEQLLEFVLDNYRNDFTDDQTKKYQFLLDQFITRIKLLPKREEAAIMRLEKIKKVR